MASSSGASAGGNNEPPSGSGGESAGSFNQFMSEVKPLISCSFTKVQAVHFGEILWT